MGTPKQRRDINKRDTQSITRGRERKKQRKEGEEGEEEGGEEKRREEGRRGGEEGGGGEEDGRKEEEKRRGEKEKRRGGGEEEVRRAESGWCAAPSATSPIDSRMSASFSPRPIRTPTLRLREAGPKHVSMRSPIPDRPFTVVASESPMA